MNLCWRWELTPKELFAGFRPVKDEPSAKLVVAKKSFEDAEKRTLENTPYTYQIVTEGDLQGVIVFDQDDTIIGSLLLRGWILSTYALAVAPAYRNQNLAFLMLVEWCDQTQRPRVLSPQGITLASAKALLAAHKVVVQRAIDAGKAVSDRVLLSVSDDREAGEVLQAWT